MSFREDRAWHGAVPGDFSRGVKYEGFAVFRLKASQTGIWKHCVGLLTNNQDMDSGTRNSS